MVDIDNHYEQQTAGDTVTVANSDDFGDFAVDNVTLNTGDITYDDDIFLGGTRNLYFQPAAGQSQFVQYSQDADHTVGRFRFNFYFESLPSSTIDFPLRFVSAANGTQATIQMLTNGRWQISAGGTATSTSTLAPLTKYRCEGNYINVNSAGSITFKVFNGLSAGASLIQSVTLNSVTTGAAWRRARIGKLLGAPTLGNFRVDDFRWIRDANTPDLGPYLIPPTCDAGNDQIGIEAFKTVTVTGTDNDNDGTVVTRTWRVVSVTGGAATPTLSGSGTSRTFKAPGTLSGTDILLGYKVTDNDALDSVEDFTTVSVFPATSRAVVGGVEVPMEIQAIA